MSGYRYYSDSEKIVQVVIKNKAMNPNNKDQQDIHQSDTSNKTLNTDDNWIKKIWAWADEFELKDSEIPRDKEPLLALKKLEIVEPELDEQHSRDVYRIAYLPDELTKLTNPEFHKAT